MSIENPWKCLSSRIAYSNPWISVREDQVLRPDGQPGIYGVVQARIATGVVALTPEQQVVLVGQFRYATKMYSWEIVQGGTDDGEDPLHACRRELEEEAGLVADSWYSLGGEFHLSNCTSSEVGFIYLAEGLRETQAAPEGTEQLALKRVPLRDAVRMACEGEIVDAVSVIGLLLAERWLAAHGRLQYTAS